MRTPSPDVVTSKLDEGNHLRGSEVLSGPLPKQFMSTMLTQAYHDVNVQIKDTWIKNMFEGNYLEIPTQESIKAMCTERMVKLAEADLRKMISPIEVVTDKIMPTQMYVLGKDHDVRTHVTSDMTPLMQQVCAVQDGVDGLLLLIPKANDA